MAVYEEIVKSVAINLRCSICFEIFRDPVTLACGHSYCHECIKDIKKLEMGSRKCPQCRAVIGESQKLKKNVTLCNILDLPVAGGRDEWDRISTRSDQDTEINDHSYCTTDVTCSSCDGTSSSDLTNSSLDSEGGSQSTDYSFSSQSGHEDSQNAFSQMEESENIVYDGEMDQMDISRVQQQDGLFLTALPGAYSLSSASSAAATMFTDPADEVPNADFALLFFPPHLGKRCLLFKPEERKIEVKKVCSSPHDRFDTCQWMAQEEFTSGRHYWDVDVSRCSSWAVGVASPTLRKDQKLGCGSTSWCIEWSSNKLSALHNSVKTPLQHGCPSRVRILLDMDDGRLTFQRLSDGVELYSMRMGFSGPVSPVVWMFGMKQQNTLTFPLPSVYY